MNPVRVTVGGISPGVELRVLNFRDDPPAHGVVGDGGKRGFGVAVVAHQITGAMAMATGVVTPLQDTYTPRVNAAGALNPAGATLPTPERPPGHTAVVAAGMAYSAYEEYGTSRRGPHPWFVVGMEAGRQHAAQVTAPHLKRALEHP